MSYTPDRLTNLDDVTIVTPTTGQVLKYNATSAKWENGVDATGAGGSTTLEQFSLMNAFPFTIGATVTTAVRTNTSTTMTATVARVFPFFLPGALTLNSVLVQTVAAGTGNIQLGIFNSAGTQVWTSGNQNTVAGNMVVPVSAVALAAGQYYFATTVGTAAVTATAVYQTAPLFTASTIPRWGTVPATGGVMPASITPTAITETTGPFITYVVLSNWST